MAKVESESSIVPLKVEKKEEEGGKEEVYDLSFLKKPFFWQLTSVILLILLVISLFSAFSSPTGAVVNDIGGDDAKEKVQDYVDAVLQDRFSAALGDAVEEGGLYRIDVYIQGQTIQSYITKDGKLFFPNVIDLDRFKALANAGVVVPTIDKSGAAQFEDLNDTVEEVNESEESD